MQARAVLLAVAVVGGGTLTACGGSTAPATPVATSIQLTPSTSTLDAVGATVQLAAVVLDQNGRSMTSVSVTWTSSSQAIATVSSSGLVTATGNGSAQVTATVGSAHAQASVAVAQIARSIAKVSGDQQTGFTSQALTSALVIQVNDRLGHGVDGIIVRFAAAAGSGSVSPSTDTTASNGRAQTTWTLGSASGAQSMSASAAQLDSATFTASAEARLGSPTISGIAPDTLVEGATATITGTNFSPTPANNSVTIDGVSATVSVATSNSLTVTVPTYSCAPTRLVTVGVQVGGQSAASSPMPLRPATMTSLVVGQETIVQDPTKFCLQFGASVGGNELYVMGLSAPAEVPGAVLPFLISTQGGASVGATVASQSKTVLPVRASFARSAMMRRPAGFGAAGPGDIWRDRARAELKLRNWEASHVPQLMKAVRKNPSRQLMHASGALVPAVGDTLTIRVPDVNATNLCTSFTSIRAVVRVVGSAGIWVEDVANPTTDSLTLSDIQSASDQFDSKIFATDTSYFGSPSDIDENGRVIIVLTWQVNKAPRILGFVFGGDLTPAAGSSCPESNGGELYYGQVPDPSNVAGTGARAKADVVAEMPQLIAHEFTHVIQMSQRFILHSGTSMTSWEMEGQATFAEELVGVLC